MSDLKKKQIFAWSYFRMQTEEKWLHSEQEQEIFLYSRNVHTSPGAHQGAVQWVPGVLFNGAKRPAHEAAHSLQFSAEVKN